ncbi:MAG: hypothetical protein KC583_12705, partial [Myxococcales bacterium]|nr:hypothetical protein [Myxococcales bacterium]
TDGPFTARVFGAQGDSAEYRVLAAVACPEPLTCPDDDDGGADDVLADANDLPLGTPTAGLVCGADEDWYAVDAQLGCRYDAGLLFRHARGDLALTLVGADGAALDVADTATDDEALSFYPAADGPAWLVVTGSGDAFTDNEYELTVSALCPPVRCPGDDDSEDNDSLEQATALANGIPLEAVSCGADEDWYTVDAMAGDTLVLRVDTVFGPLAPRVAVHGADGAEIVVAAGRDLRRVLDADGPYYIRVTTAGDAPFARYDLTASVVGAALSCPADDLYEDNDTRETASPIESGERRDAIVCGADRDIYAIEAAAGCTVRAALTFDHAGGNIDGRLRGPAGGIIATGISTDDDEAFEAVVDADGTYYLDVNLIGDANTYAVQVFVEDCPGASLCPEDDAFEDNDDLGAAFPLGVVTAEGALCPGDPDFYAVDVDAGCTLAATLIADDADVALRLLDGAGDPLQIVDPTNGRARVLYETAEAATLYLQPDGPESAYSLAARVVCPEDVVCPADDAREDDDTAADATPLGAGVEARAIACGDDDDWYALDVGPGCTVRADLTFAHADGDLDLRLFGDPNGVPLAEGTSATDDEHLEAIVGRPGVYYLRVNGVGPVSTAYGLTATVECPAAPTCPDDDAREDDDDADNATRLASGEVIADAIACDGDADWYVVAAEAGCIVRADVYHASDLRVTLVDPEDAEVAAVGVPTGDQLEHVAAATGDHYVRVDGGEGPYAIAVDVVCPPPFTCPGDDDLEPDDDAATATVLAADTPVEAILCAGDEDWFVPPAQAGCRLVADLGFRHLDGDLDLALIGPGGATVEVADSVTDDEHLEVPLRADNGYRLRVFGLAGAGALYTLNARLDCTCEDDAGEDDDTVDDARPLADQPIQGVICGADEDWFALGQVEAGCQVDVGVLYATRDGDLDVSIHAADGTALATADGADQGGPVARLRTEGAAPLYAR